VTPRSRSSWHRACSSPEELLFRGYAFQQIVRLGAPGTAVVLTAAAFGAYHQLGAGVFLMPALGGLVFGYALVRSGGLALPIGLHWGGNWVQALTSEAMPRVPYVVALALMALAVRLATRDARPA
jgi:membrane protease YdiL (CAAX protease family)